MKDIIYNIVSKHWGLAEDSLKVFKELLYSPKQDDFIEALISSSEDRRVRFQLDDKYREKIDEGWKLFKEHFADFCNVYKVKYENFFNNNVLVGKNTIKMKKAITDFYINQSPKDFNTHAPIYSDIVPTDTKNILKRPGYDQGFNLLSRNSDSRLILTTLSVASNVMERVLNRKSPLVNDDTSEATIKIDGDTIRPNVLLGAARLTAPFKNSGRDAFNVVVAEVSKGNETGICIFAEKGTTSVFHNVTKLMPLFYDSVSSCYLEALPNNNFNLWVHDGNKLKCLSFCISTMFKGGKISTSTRELDIPESYRSLRFNRVVADVADFYSKKSGKFIFFNLLEDFTKIDEEDVPPTDTNSPEFIYSLTKEIYVYRRSNGSIELTFKMDKAAMEEHVDKDITKKLERVGAVALPKNKKLELVISANFIDWFLCSTSENWTSCLNLDSHFSGCHYTGLAGLVGDPNRVMVYITDGSKKKYGGVETEKFLSRSWALLDGSNTLNIIKFYPLEVLDPKFLSEISSIRFKWIEPDFVSKKPLDMLFFKYSDSYDVSCYMFLDRARLNMNNNTVTVRGNSENNFSYISRSRKTGKKKLVSGEHIFNWDRGLSAIVEKEGKLTDYMKESLRLTDFRCNKCGTGLEEEDPDSYIEHDGSTMCLRCFNDRYERCQECGEIIRKGTKICSSCKEKLYKKCDMCLEMFNIKKTTLYTAVPRKANTGRTEATLCPDCRTKALERGYKECGTCGKLVHEEVLENHMLVEHGVGAVSLGAPADSFSTVLSVLQSRE